MTFLKNLLIIILLILTFTPVAIIFILTKILNPILDVIEKLSDGDE